MIYVADEVQVNFTPYYAYWWSGDIYTTSLTWP